MATIEKVPEKACCTSTPTLAAAALPMANQRCTSQTVLTAAAHVTPVHTSSRSRMMTPLTPAVAPVTIWTRPTAAAKGPSATSGHHYRRHCHSTIPLSTSTATTNCHFPRARGSAMVVVVVVITTVICNSNNNINTNTNITTKDMAPFAMLMLWSVNVRAVVDMALPPRAIDQYTELAPSPVCPLSSVITVWQNWLAQFTVHFPLVSSSAAITICHQLKQQQWHLHCPVRPTRSKPTLRLPSHWRRSALPTLLPATESPSFRTLARAAAAAAVAAVHLPAEPTRVAQMAPVDPRPLHSITLIIIIISGEVKWCLLPLPATNQLRWEMPLHCDTLQSQLQLTQYGSKISTSLIAVQVESTFASQQPVMASSAAVVCRVSQTALTMAPTVRYCMKGRGQIA